jgi:hypothetical protein
MAYDVHRRPATYLDQQVARRSRWFWSLFTAYGVGFVLACVAWANGRHTAAGMFVAAMACVIIGARLVADDVVSWRKGAEAESAVGQELDALRADGYVVMHDFMLGGKRNCDHLVSGPNGVFVVETKFRRYEVKHLGIVKRQALQLHDELGCWVTPVICAGVRHRSFEHARVLITGRGILADAIKQRPPSGRVDLERLARFADRLS